MHMCVHATRTRFVFAERTLKWIRARTAILTRPAQRQWCEKPMPRHLHEAVGSRFFDRFVAAGGSGDGVATRTQNFLILQFYFFYLNNGRAVCSR